MAPVPLASPEAIAEVTREIERDICSIGPMSTSWDLAAMVAGESKDEAVREAWARREKERDPDARPVWVVYVDLVR